MTTLFKHFFLFPISALLLSSCDCSESPSSADSDTSPDPVDPQVEWVEIPSGSFTFGSPDGTPCQAPIHEMEVPVTLTRSFLMSKYEITQKQWAAMGFPVPPIDPICDDCPVQYVNWYEALAWCNALSRFEGLEECYDLSDCTGEIGNECWAQDLDCPGGEQEFVCGGGWARTRKYELMYGCKGYRLPTGPEWEYAAKAGTTTTTYNGDITTDTSAGCVQDPVLDDIAWYCFNTGYMNGSDPWSIDSLELLQEVGLKQPNPFGLYDMLGNAMEWTDYVSTGLSLDDNEGKPGEALTDPMGAHEEEDDRRALRGLGFNFYGCYVRASYPFGDDNFHRLPGYGFRPVRTLPAE